MTALADEKIPEVCCSCKQKRIRLCKITPTGTTTKNFVMACINKKCFSYCDLNKTPSWVKVN